MAVNSDIDTTVNIVVEKLQLKPHIDFKAVASSISSTGSSSTDNNSFLQMKQLISDLDVLNQQQQAAEVDRRTASTVTTTAHTQVASLESALHSELRQAAEMDDALADVKMQLAIRVTDQIQNEEDSTNLTKQHKELSSSVQALYKEFDERSLITAELKRNLLLLGIEEARLQELEIRALSTGTTEGESTVNEGKTKPINSSAKQVQFNTPYSRQSPIKERWFRRPTAQLLNPFRQH